MRVHVLTTSTRSLADNKGVASGTLIPTNKTLIFVCFIHLQENPSHGNKMVYL